MSEDDAEASKSFREVLKETVGHAKTPKAQQEEVDQQRELAKVEKQREKRAQELLKEHTVGLEDQVKAAAKRGYTETTVWTEEYDDQSSEEAQAGLLAMRHLVEHLESIGLDGRLANEPLNHGITASVIASWR